jgi:hypothetical protein
MIRLKYLLEYQPLVICRKLPVKTADYANELNKALYAASNAIYRRRA